MGRLDPSRRSVPLVTATTEDWLWFQLAMLDEDEEGSGLNSLGEVLMGYGERYFEGGGASAGTEGQVQPKGRTGLWASVLMMTGQFERVCQCGRSKAPTESDECFFVGCRCTMGSSRDRDRGGPYGYRSLVPRPHPCSISNGHRRTNTYAPTFSSLSLLSLPFNLSRCSFTAQTVSFLPNGQVALDLPTLIWRYVRQFVKMDGKEALQYVYTVTLNADQPGVGEEQVEQAWEMVRRIITLANAGPAWDELVGGFRPDGNKFVSFYLHLSWLKTHSIS